MFFRRMFTRKDTNSVGEEEIDDSDCPSSSNHQPSQQRHVLSSTPRLARKNNQQQNLSSAGSHRPGSVLQLTPLWEYILRTRTLPDNVCPKEMFNEFLERLRDAEWQVRQHALRVLVDVLVVMGPKADAYMDPLVSQLVENLGHQAPTVRKGALDCLRVYLAETEMPETVLLQILDIGLNQKITNEPFGGRLTCGVMLSLPALVQSTLHTTKRNYILRTTIDMLVSKMGQVTHQEITLKVLTKVRELIGSREFSEYMSHGAFREFELLCSVYGVGESKELNSSTKSWRMVPTLQSESDGQSMNQTEGCWKFSDEEKIMECPSSSSASKEKVILETEIQINDDTLTMRILEEKEDSEVPDNYPSSAEDEVISGPPLETTGIIHVLSDSEVEEINRRVSDEYYVTPPTPRTPKRVTFGGEIVKMRTPDSDATVVNEEPKSSIDSKTNVLSLEIPNDNTKPISSSTSSSPSHTCKHSKHDSSDSAATTPVSPVSPVRKEPENQENDVSPRSPFKRLTVSSVDTIVSPRGPHKEIEVLHNLQREPSPVRARRASIRIEDEEFEEKIERIQQQQQQQSSKDQPKPPKSWEELDIVDDDVLMDLRSGDWRQRSNGIYALEDALRSSENLARVQPCLDSLLRTLLSSEKNPEVAEEKRRVLMNLISRLPLDNLEDRTVQIITGLCRQGGPGANRASKALMQRLPPAVIVLKLISDEFLHAKSSRFRENALQMVMYALMTFPSTCFDTNTCVTSAALAALDRKKRVRQAALDVLAILGQVTSPRVVLEVVQNIAASRENGNEFFAAVKARLSRKQLPLVSPDGTVQYTLRVPSPQSQERTSLANMGSDLEWIASGVGSVSPTSLKRRAHKYRNQQSCCQSFNNYSMNSHEDSKRYRPPHEMLALGVEVKDINTDYATSDDNHSMANNNNNNNNIQYVLGKTVPLQYTSMKSMKNGGGGGTTSNNGGGGGEIIGINGKRIATKSCSDSSGDGRSSDSTYTTSSSGNGAINLNGRFARQSVTSRFPTMERIDMTGNYLPKQMYKNPFLIYNTRNQVHLNSTYPKVNYTMQQNRKHITRTNQRPLYFSNQDTFDESSFGEECHEFKPTAYAGGGGGNGNGNGYGPGGATVEHNHYNNHHETTNGNSRRFVNVEKFIQSNKTSLQSYSNGNSVAPSPIHETPPVTPHMTIPYSMPTKPHIRQNNGNHNGNIVEGWSHASVREYHSEDQHKSPKVVPNEQPCSTPITTVVATLQSSPNEVDLKSSINEATKSEINGKDLPDNEVVESSSGDVVIEPLSPEKESPKIEPKTSALQSENTPVEEKSTKPEEPVVETVDTPDYESQAVTPTSRPQSGISAKSQVIEEELDCDQPPPVEPDRVSEATQEVLEDLEDISDYEDNIVTPKTPTEPLSPFKGHNNNQDEARAPTPNIEDTHISPPRSPTIQEIKALSRKSSFAKSCDSLFDRTSSKLDADNSTETSSDYQSSHLNNTLTDFTPIKPQHIPLQRKSKTLFMKKHRRISPVKQTINMGQAELYPQNMTRFEKPREALHKAFDQLDSSNWEVNVIGLKSMVRLMRYHPDTLDNQMHMTCIQLTKSVRNLRSQVSRAACQASTELFTMKCKFLEQECDDLVCALLHRTADTNRFLRADATRGLESMCDNLTPSKVLNIMCSKGATHQNAIVRTTTAKLLNRLADRLGCDKIYAMGRENRDKFIITGANLLLEGSLETRSYAKSLFRLMSSHQNYSRLLLEVIPTRTYRNIEKTLKNIR
ncbi:uncharacterized protein LOC129921179 [Episyrphus balteatus]|uniref:uncharacterized protein LOC129921179 n=1 Tax=Episyrphus balteatus TaxID=286459 RepID=UPI002485BFD4|nr:uncharacterized protein LOC129921179 [Episyrphus balteatus]